MDAGVPEENIITDGLWLWEHYTYTNYTSYRDGYEYRVSFTVKVPGGSRSRGCSGWQAVAGGATSTGSLTQTVSDAGDLYTEALGAAVESARQSAEKLAAASGKTVGKALYITESGYGVARRPSATILIQAADISRRIPLRRPHRSCRDWNRWKPR